MGSARDSLDGPSLFWVFLFNAAAALVLQALGASSMAEPSSNCYAFDKSGHLYDFSSWIGHSFEYEGKSSDLAVRFCKDVESRAQAGYTDFGRFDTFSHFVAGTGHVNFIQEFYSGDLAKCEQSYDKMGRTAQVNIICGSCLNGRCKGDLGCICNVTYESTCRVFAEPKEDEEIPDDKVNWYEKFALCVTRVYDNQNRWIQKTSLQVNSPALKSILSDVIGSYPGQSFYTTDITIDFPAHCLYHYRPELKAALADQEPESEGAAHLPILLDFIEEHHSEVIKEGDNLREKGLVSYDHLWTIFKPGSLVFCTRMGQPRAFKLNSYQYVCGQSPGLELSVQYVDYDGDDFGSRNTYILVPAFTGATSIATLSALPLKFHPDPEGITTLLAERGRRWEALAGQNFREYKGVATDAKGSRYNVDGRVMVDTHTFHRIEANHAFSVEAFPRVKGDGSGKRKLSHNSNEWSLVPDDSPVYMAAPLTDEQCLLASPMVRGFSFTEKKFLQFFVDKLSPIDWNTKCFEQLVLPDHQKELVQALVAEHTQRATASSAGFDDIVKGKGQGLILVLHGPPGVGKTLTAECVAEFSQRPLYIVSSGDLGTSSSVLDERLGRILDLASTWKAVLLIDEADVFLERRSLHDMERNGLVSIFLRTLEYYSGILFMTTNRVKTFDDAFKSRIHVPLKYEELPASSRIKVWKNFLAKDAAEGAVDIDEAGYMQLANGRLNGRQIKNVVRTAKSLASHKRRKLDQKQLQQVMEIQMAFEEELDKAGSEDIDMVER